MTPPPQDSDMLAADEVQRMLGISEATYYRWVREGRLRGVKVGRRWRFPRRAVEALLKPDAGSAPQEDVERAVEIAESRMRDLTPEDEMLTARPLAELMNERVTGGPPSFEGAATVADLARLVLEHALVGGASDLHIDPLSDGIAIRERIRGNLHPLDPPLPAGSLAPLVAALKQLCGLDPDLDNRPQSGHFFISVGSRKVDVRLSTFPTSLGESLSLRLLGPTAALRIEDLGYPARIVTPLRLALHARPWGIVFVTGQAGSGKQTTLYSLLRELQRPERKIMTIEDPVSVHLDGVLQASVSHDFTFEDAMRAMLDNDLDIGMVSEIRTQEAMDLLFMMSRTGHKLLAALHARDCARALQTLVELGGIDANLIVENVQGILAQRLARGSCPSCRGSRRLEAKEADAIGLEGPARRQKVASNDGCDACGGTGNAARVVVSEFVTVANELASVLRRGVSVEEIRAAFPPDFRGIRDDILDRMSAGDLSYESARLVLDV